MRTRSILLTASLLFATAGAFAQVPKPIAIATPIATITPSATVGQTITLAGTAYTVSAKKVIATGVEYYTVKATTSLKAPSTYFLRTNNKYNSTVFTQAQYEAFIKTGKLSSFGSLKKGVVVGRNMSYVTKGTTNVLFAANKGTLSMYEFIGDLSTVMTAEEEQPQSPERTSCKLGCNDRYGTGSECEAEFPPPVGVETDDVCGNELFACWGRCDDAFESRKPSLHVVKSITTIKYL